MPFFDLPTKNQNAPSALHIPQSPSLNPQPKNKSHIHHSTCPRCGKVAEVIASTVGKTKTQKILKCGHAIFEDNAVVSDSSSLTDIVFADGARPRSYQLEVLQKTEAAGFRALWRLEQRLGKTVCALLALKTHPELKPCIIVCKKGIMMQWFMEIMDRLDDVAQVIRSSSELPRLDIVIVSIDTLARAKWLEDEKNYSRYKTIFIDECQTIKNHDASRTNAFRKLCGRSITIKREYNPDLKERPKIKMMALDLMKYHGIDKKFKLSFEPMENNKLGLTQCKIAKNGLEDEVISGTIIINRKHAIHDKEDDVLETIVHEIAHAITPGAGHSAFWSATCVSIGGDGKAFAKIGCSGTVEPTNEFEKPINVIALSGTPIKNHAGEYFPILNILHPELFPYREPFIRDWVDSYSDGYGSKLGGIKPYRLDSFKKLTDPFIFNYTREQVAPDLPTVDRQPLFVEIENKEVRKAYGKALDEFIDAAEDEDSSTSIIGKLAKLRHIVGFSKIVPVKDYIDEFVESTEGKRNLIVFVHHKDVGELLTKRLKDSGYKVLTYTSDLGTNQRFAVIEQFNQAEGTILVASTGAAGEGVTIKNCNDLIMMERQWNPASEEQAEARPINYETKDSKINVIYPTAVGTIDEMFANIVGRKRANVNRTLTGDRTIAWDSDSIMKELAQELVRKGKNAWKI